jgi:acyl-coenzyme A synthetase/AMP-(fatty) acid ligase
MEKKCPRHSSCAAPPPPGLDAEEVHAFVAARVAPYTKVGRVEFLDQIPKLLAGKILREDRRLRESAM